MDACSRPRPTSPSPLGGDDGTPVEPLVIAPLPEQSS
jgi:hypothetical protein